MMNQFMLLLSLLLMAPLRPTIQQQNTTPPAPLKVGVSIGITAITPEGMAYAKSAGISSLQVSLNPLVDKTGHLKFSDQQITEEVKKVKAATDEAGIKIEAFHMPFGQYVDLSLMDETSRKRVVALHQKLLRLCAALAPEIVLFHPSWYLSLNQRKGHIDQLVKSVLALEKPVKDIGATMVIENMTGPQLYVERKGVKYERPLCRTVPEMITIMRKLPAGVYAAVDMNHILHPEKLVLTLGKRLKFIHVSDGDGAHEYHYLPCNSKGLNDWVAILSALYEVGYKGPFMFECHYKDMKQLVPCYKQLYDEFIMAKYPAAGSALQK